MFYLSVDTTLIADDFTKLHDDGLFVVIVDKKKARSDFRSVMGCNP